ncbi:DUF4307 domain-containing protein [Amycolatopsis sp. H20-H5]|uniref:DUF4307 domain-containing protein n=1 Tax=Amycolatopsis sp. H20-H5 TaxID=3046309 RepID=UPI002DBC8429|nr:DUF4307 domain-containing protein [Amycolatopsis sp. H20-H5]MEC3979857.1 DUF4307 domain-containing protein [Amycolatopsis sp. H20-H5]
MSAGQAAPAESAAHPALPSGRYGSAGRQRSKRWRRWLFVVIALLVGATIAVVAYQNLGDGPISAERVAFKELPGNAIQITIQVTRDEPDNAGVCIVRARDKTGAESGRREVLVRAGEKNGTLTTVIKSVGRPVTADVYGCSYDVPRYLSSS